VAGGEEEKAAEKVETWLSKGVFYLIMFFVLVGFFQTLGLVSITEPLNRLLNTIFEYAPRLIAPIVLLLVAWVLATAMRFSLSRILQATKLDERLSSKAGIEKEKPPIPLTKSLTDAVYWLVFLLFLPAVLDALKLEGIMIPVQGMVDQILGYLPNLFGAFLIFMVGWFIARIVQQVVGNVLAAIGTDRLSDRVGLAPLLGAQRLSGILGLVVYILILIPVIIAALNALALEAVTRPASEMLNVILSALPNIFAAFVLVTIAYVVGRVVAQLITNLLTGVGFNRILTRIGLARELAEGKRTPSEVIGYLVLLAILFFAAMEACDLLGFKDLADLVKQFTVFAGHVLLGLIIFGIGLFLADLAYKTIIAGEAAQAAMMASAARIAIVGIAGAMALRQMGFANEIINLAFGLLMGAVAVAVAIAFGLGGRDIASRKMEEWLKDSKAGKP
jgi:hypothetical protein